jgi:uncharacterized iron-regulated membrane protein
MIECGRIDRTVGMALQGFAICRLAAVPSRIVAIAFFCQRVRRRRSARGRRLRIIVVMQLSLKSVFFRLHWISGLAAGLVLAVVGVTGALLGFETESIRLLNPALQIEGAHGAPVPLGALVDAAKAARPDGRVRGIAWEGDDAALIVRMSNGRERGTLPVAVDPHRGVVLGIPRGTAFFETVEQLHRNLAAGPIGRQLVGASTAILIILAISGLWLRWPRRPSLKSWLTFNPKLRGRAFMWHLHSVAGTWLLAFYLIAALTGLWWSYDFYRDAVNHLAGVTLPTRPAAPSDARADIPAATIDAAWAVFRREAPDASRATLTLAGDADAPIEIRYQTPASAHSRAWNTLKIDAKSGESVSQELYAELPRGRRFIASLPFAFGRFLRLAGAHRDGGRRAADAALLGDRHLDVGAATRSGESARSAKGLRSCERPAPANGTRWLNLRMASVAMQGIFVAVCNNEYYCESLSS